MNRLYFAPFLFLFALASCATGAPRDSSFDPQSGNALLVFVDYLDPPIFSDPPVAQTYIRAIDWTSRTFDGPFRLVVTMKGGPYTLGAARQSNAIFAVMPSSRGRIARELPAGDYAVIGRFSVTGTPTYSTSSATTVGRSYRDMLCFNGRAPTFSVRAGEIVLARLREMALTDEELLSEFNQLRANYPNLRGQARVVQFDQYIAFGEDAQLDEEDCLNRLNFTEKTS